MGFTWGLSWSWPWMILSHGRLMACLQTRKLSKLFSNLSLALTLFLSRGCTSLLEVMMEYLKGLREHSSHHKHPRPVMTVGPHSKPISWNNYHPRSWSVILVTRSFLGVNYHLNF